MAATHLTLEEAAERLGISPEEFKKRLKIDPAFKILVPIRDGSSLRFKSGAIDELARQLGAASDPELPLSPMDDSLPPDSDDFKVAGASAKGDKKSPRKGEHDPLPLAAGDDDIFSLTSDESKSQPGSRRRRETATLASNPASRRRVSGKEDESVVPTEELAIDFGGPGSAVIKGGSSSKLSAPKSSGKISSGKLSASDSSKSLPNPAGGDSSEFELSLDADSDDFELKLNTEASDEVALGAVPKEPSGAAVSVAAAVAGSISAIRPTAASRSRRGRARRAASPLAAEARQRLGRGLRIDAGFLGGRVRRQALPDEGEEGPGIRQRIRTDSRRLRRLGHRTRRARRCGAGGRQGRHLRDRFRDPPDGSGRFRLRGGGARIGHRSGEIRRRRRRGHERQRGRAAGG